MIPHPFHDPASLYNRLRKASPADQRTIGYFSWLKKKRELNQKTRLVLEPSDLTREGTPLGMGAYTETPLGMGTDSGVPNVIVIRIDQPQIPVPLAENGYRRPMSDPQVETAYWVEFDLAKESDWPEKEVSCRVHLLDTPMLHRLRERLNQENVTLPENDAVFIRQLFDFDLLAENRNIAGLLSSLAELNGSIHPTGTGSAELRQGLPEGAPNIPKDTWTIIVYNRNK